jgi:hypothetical protein
LLSILGIDKVQEENLGWSKYCIADKNISVFQSSDIGGHSGIQATFQRVQKLFFWQGLKQVNDSLIKQCLVCQHAKYENCKTPRILTPLPIPASTWQDLSMNFIDGLPKCEGYSVILVVVDCFTKYAHFLPLKHPYIA